MRDCVILINDSLSHTNSLVLNSLVLIQPPTSPQSSSPIWVRVLVRVFGTVGTVEKVVFVCRVLASEHLIVLVHDILDRGFVRELVHHDRNHVSEGVFLPDMSGTTSTGEGETIEVSVGVVSCCVRGKVPYQYCRNGRGYFMKNILSSLDPPGSVLSCPSTPISWSSIA